MKRLNTPTWSITFKLGKSFFLSSLKRLSKLPLYRIQNPLRNIPKAKLLRQVEAFVADKGLQDKTELFKKAALLAQNPKDFENLHELTEDDKVVIRRETTRQFLLSPQG